MARLPISLIAFAVTGVVLAAASAQAQFGSIFGNDPPRPPANVPSRQPAPPVDPQPPPVTLAPPGRPPAGGQSGIQSQPLPPPPPGAASAPPAVPLTGGAATAPLPGLPPGQRQPRGTPQQGNAALQPPDDVAPEIPTEKVVNPTGVFAGLDKITGRITSFDVTMGETVQFGALQVTPRACYTRKPTETPNTDAFIEVDEVTLQGEVRRIYTGWMYAASPGLHAVEHPIYDVWLTDCKGGVVAEAVPPPEPAAAPARTPPRPQQQTPPRPAQPRAPAPQPQFPSPSAPLR
jgi:hypothetical protein